jgi:hypothetical protein
MPPNQRWEDSIEPSVVNSSYLPQDDVVKTRCAVLGTCTVLRDFGRHDGLSHDIACVLTPFVVL